MNATAIQPLDSLLWRLSRVGAARTPPSLTTLALVVVIAGPLYGAFMGSYALASPDRLLMVLYSALKMPILIFGTSLICLPAFFVLNSIAGLRQDFGEACRAVLAGQAALTISLASLGPFTRFIYFCGVEHHPAILVNAAMFALAAAFGHLVMCRWYRPLIARSPRHRALAWSWIVMYAFVGIEMGWMLRPFIGRPGMPVAFFRDEPFSNAYVVIVRMLLEM